MASRAGSSSNGGTRRDASMHVLAVAVVAATCVAILALPGIAHAAGVSAVSMASAQPRGFVPNWDGETDSTVIDYVLAERSVVAVRILDARGHVVTTIDAGVRQAGTQLVAWDGRDAHGSVQPAGTYRVRVDARPAPIRHASGGPGASAMGGNLVVAGARAATIVVQAPPIALRGVRLSRASLGRAGKTAATSVSFDLSSSASVSAAIVDRDGRAVRTLVAGRMRAGSSRLGWNGRSTDGALVADGDYALVVAASGGGRPTATQRLPLHVDRTLPTLKAAARVTAKVSSSRVTIPLPVTLGETSTIIVAFGRHSVRRAVRAGSATLAIPGGELGIGPSKRTRTLRLRVRATDAAGNAVSRVATVVVPRTAAPKPAPPSGGGGSTHDTPAPAGRWPWPVSGVITSPFGMRDGAMHAGVDIAAPTGTPIHPAIAGTVAYVGQMSGYGNVVDVTHPNGIRTRYAHMSRFGGFAVGDHVEHLDVIGYVGCTGHCTGPHVHFETRTGTWPKDVPHDPMAYLAAP
jgi:murein DD-endopeptidase MepM/ murein hydrolase activator NlpD